MLLVDYFHQIEEVISSFPAITSREISFEQRTSHIGLIKGILIFHGSSQLHFKEFVDVGKEIKKGVRLAII